MGITPVCFGAVFVSFTNKEAALKAAQRFDISPLEFTSFERPNGQKHTPVTPDAPKVLTYFVVNGPSDSDKSTLSETPEDAGSGSGVLVKRGTTRIQKLQTNLRQKAKIIE